MDNYRRTVCFVGHRPENFPWKYYNKNNPFQKKYFEYVDFLVKKYAERGFIHFLVAGENGTPLDVAETVLKYRELYPQIRLEIVAPYPTRPNKFNEEERIRYDKIIKAANATFCIAEEYTATCMVETFETMIDRSREVVVFTSGENRGCTNYSIDYALKKWKVLDIIHLPNFLIKETYQEFAGELRQRKKEK